MSCRTTENEVEVAAVLDHNLGSYTLSDSHWSDFHLAFVIISKSMYSIHVKANETRNQAGNSSLGFCDDVPFNNINRDRSVVQEKCRLGMSSGGCFVLKMPLFGFEILAKLPF